MSLWVGAVKNYYVHHVASLNTLFQVFKTSQLFDIVNKSDEEFDGDEFLERNAISASDFSNEYTAGHNANTEKSSS